MNRNTLYLIIGALLVVVVGFAIYAYQQESRPSGIEIQINEDGFFLDGN